MEDFTWREVGQRLKCWRVAAGLTQRGLAATVALSQPAIQVIESGACNPQLDSLQRLAAALGRTTRELICGQVLVHDLRAQRLERVLGSRNELATAAAEQELACAEVLLESSPQRFVTTQRGRIRRYLSKKESAGLEGAFESATGAPLKRRVAGEDLSRVGPTDKKRRSTGGIAMKSQWSSMPITVNSRSEQTRVSPRRTNRLETDLE
jgi:transcriptional regulator with XRE-family HTH domain